MIWSNLLTLSIVKQRERKKSEVIVESCPNVSKECLFNYQPIGLPIISNYYLILNCAVVNKTIEILYRSCRGSYLIYLFALESNADKNFDASLTV